MKRDSKTSDGGDMLPEYDFSGGERGKYATRYAEGTNLVLLDPDVAEAFADSRSVNDALRSVIGLAQLVGAGPTDEAASGPARSPGALTASPEAVAKARFSLGTVRRLRKRLGLTQMELAAVLGLSRTTVAYWEQGRSRPADENREALVALRKLGRRDIQRLLEDNTTRR
ncbi:MAG: helix-turn-helix domain-containing protein [Planctomycetota bacterium]